MKRKIKVLLIFDSPYFVPRGYEFKDEFKDVDWDAERFVYQALLENNYQVSLLGIHNDIEILFEQIKDDKPDVIFNLVEVFDQKYYLDKNIAAVLELLQIPYTGSSPRSLILCGDKALTKKILTYHKIRVPRFHTFYRARKVWLPKRLRFPVIVKPLTDEASRGLSQASVVDNEQSFIERIKFLQKNLDADVITEEYIDGREFYVSIIGKKRLRVLPMREMKFGKFPQDEPRVATYKAKWDYEYRQRWGIQNVFSGRLSGGLKERIENVCKRAYRALNMENYARFDIRVDKDSRIFILEANANPSLDKDDELAEAANKAGIDYTKLIKKIVDLSFKRT